VDDLLNKYNPLYDQLFNESTGNTHITTTGANTDFSKLID